MKDENKKTQKIEILEAKEYVAIENEVIIKPQKKNGDFFKKSPTKTNNLFVLGVIFLLIFSIVEFFLPFFVGIFVAWQAISIFFKEEKALGLLLLFIGTPVAIVISYYASAVFFYIISILILALMASFLFINFWVAIKRKEMELFFKKNWLNIVIFSLILWLFF